MTKTRKYKNGELYRGEFKGQKKHGFGELLFPDGRNYVGNWEEDMMHGYGKYIWSDGKKFEGFFMTDRISGFGRLTEPTTLKETWGHFSDASLHGGRGVQFVSKDVSSANLSSEILVGDFWVRNELTDGFKITFDDKSAFPKVFRIQNSTAVEFVPIIELQKLHKQMYFFTSKLRDREKEVESLKDLLSQTENKESEKIINQMETHHKEELEEEKLQEKTDAEISELLEVVEKLQQKLTRREKTIIELQEQLSEAKQLESQFAQYLQQRQQLFNELEIQQAKIEAALNDRIEQLEGHLQERDVKIQELEKYLENSNSDRVEQMDLFEKIKQLEQKLKEQQENTNSVQSLASTQQDTIRQLQNMINEKESEVTELRAQVRKPIEEPPAPTPSSSQSHHHQQQQQQKIEQHSTSLIKQENSLEKVTIDETPLISPREAAKRFENSSQSTASSTTTTTSKPRTYSYLRLNNRESTVFHTPPLQDLKEHSSLDTNNNNTLNSASAGTATASTANTTNSATSIVSPRVVVKPTDVKAEHKQVDFRSVLKKKSDLNDLEKKKNAAANENKIDYLSVLRRNKSQLEEQKAKLLESELQIQNKQMEQIRRNSQSEPTAPAENFAEEVKEQTSVFSNGQDCSTPLNPLNDASNEVIEEYDD